MLRRDRREDPRVGAERAREALLEHHQLVFEMAHRLRDPAPLARRARGEEQRERRVAVERRERRGCGVARRIERMPVRQAGERVG